MASECKIRETRFTPTTSSGSPRNGSRNGTAELQNNLTFPHCKYRSGIPTQTKLYGAVTCPIIKTLGEVEVTTKIKERRWAKNQVLVKDANHNIAQASKAISHTHTLQSCNRIDNTFWSQWKAIQTSLVPHNITNALPTLQNQYHATHYLDHRVPARDWLFARISVNLTASKYSAYYSMYHDTVNGGGSRNSAQHEKDGLGTNMTEQNGVRWDRIKVVEG